MLSYEAPLEDFRFCLYELWNYQERVASLPGCEEAGSDLLDAVLEEAARFCSQELLPLNRSGDEEGCQFENGVVRTPKGFKEAYDAFVAGGWCGLACAPEFGGQGLPKTLQFAINEIVCATNLSFGTYPGLSYGAYHALELHGTEDLKTAYLPKLAEGTWSGTMCLTEPHCGTDLGLIRTKAQPHDSGSYRITGSKIFISAGEHDLAENILHLVLAKLPDAPPGTKGISLFLVPKFLPDESGAPGARNAVACGAIEHKMGIKASSTCVMNFDEAEGYLVGEKHGGMKAMFAMMNAARLAVGIQGIGLAEAAYQAAKAYAAERRAGRALKRPAEPDQPADPILVHPDVRRMLLTMRALNEGNRALVTWIASELDISERHEDAARRQEAEDLVSLLTPIVKAFGTDCGFDVSNMAMQIYGGHGYIRENGVEQLARDARIAQIYEGTNGIQALDLVGRKLSQHMGRLLRRFFHPVLAFIEENQADAAMMEYVLPLAKAFGRLQQATAWIAQSGLRDPNEAAAAASDYLRLFSLVTHAYLWALTARRILDKPEEERSDFHKAKLATGRFFMARLLPQTSGLFAAINGGAGEITKFQPDWF
jgi:butyryl-CoA dehydrogenase